MPELPEINLPVPGKGLLAIAWTVTVTAFIILLIDYKIKQEIVVSAKRVQADIERYERLYYAGKTGEAKPFSGIGEPGGSDYPSRDNVVVGTPGMEAAVPLKGVAHGVGRIDPEAAQEAIRNVNRTYARSRGRSVEVPPNGGGVESEGDAS